jgi:hypothetical protein
MSLPVKLKIARLVSEHLKPSEFAFVDSSANSARLISAVSRRSTAKVANGAKLWITPESLTDSDLKLLTKVDKFNLYLMDNPERITEVYFPEKKLSFFIVGLISLIICFGIFLEWVFIKKHIVSKEVI